MELAAENKIRQRVLSMCALRQSSRFAAASDAACRSFNKGEDEFGSARDYDDYLEQVEDIGAPQRWRERAASGGGFRCRCAFWLTSGALLAVFNLCQRIEVPATEARIAAYQAANADSITANRVKRVRAFAASLALVSRPCFGF